MKKFVQICLICSCLIPGILVAQKVCKADKENRAFFKSHPHAHIEHQRINSKTPHFEEPPNGEYIIPVVFHVYGTYFNGKSVTLALLEETLAEATKDFQGLNDDYNSVDPAFQSLRGNFKISFKLAQLDPNGNPTNGMVTYAAKSGYGNSTGYDNQIKADAWDNSKYLNVYIQNDLYDDGTTNNSGIAWYPNTWMTNNNLARIVYNGAYLASNTNKEFASTFTHEIGHYLNLYHTFFDGCSGTDFVEDTPREDGAHSLNCNPGTNCGDSYVNIENYMGYNGARGCYKMFTQGQVTRMKAALDLPSRNSLWKETNLIATGIITHAIDPVAPTIEITNPNNNYTVEEGQSVELITVVSDQNGIDDIAKVAFFDNDQLQYTDTSTPYRYTYSQLEVGSHQLKAVATDNADLTATASIHVEVLAAIQFPSIHWIRTTQRYREDGSEFYNRELYRIEIEPQEKTYDIVIKGPNSYSRNLKTSSTQTIVLEDLKAGTYTIIIPSIEKKISKSF
ncbi:MAG: M43 family zinc metalloprotease [Flavobacteriaceae bacterium]|nr:M43 family zinc metalloprotease [Flavobacteriaceae bacterium]